MPNEIIRKDPTASLPVQTKTLMNGWRTSPRNSYDSLPDVISHEEILKSPSPNLRQIGECINENQALLVIGMAINEVNSLFRADRRLDSIDMKATAKAILKRFWYLKPEDIKKCFNGPRPKSFVLEGDSFLSWLAEYDLKRDNACESVGMEDEPGICDREGASAPQGVSFEEWCKSRPREGNYLAYGRTGRPPQTDEEKKRKEAEFQQFRREYLKSKGINPK